MASTEGAQKPIELAECAVIDADSHVAERILEDLVDYVENEAVRDLLGSVDSDDELARKIFSATRTTPEFRQTHAKDDEKDDLVHEYSHDPDVKLEFMDEFGVDHSVLTPGQTLGLATVNHDQTAVALASAYNAWMADAIYDYDDRLSATLLVAHQEPDRAAEEIDRWADEDAVVGVQLPASGLIPPAGHGWFDPIYEAAEDHGLPILMHTADSPASATFPIQRHWSETFVESHLFTFPVEGMWHLISLVMNGVPERYPDLEWVFQETGVEWLPWMLWRMDDHYLQNAEDAPALGKSPSAYVRDQFYVTSQPLGHTTDHEALANVIAAAGGEDVLMFATDHPHADFDPPEELFGPLSTRFDDDAIRAMMGETAREVFGLA